LRITYDNHRLKSLLAVTELQVGSLPSDITCTSVVSCQLWDAKTSCWSSTNQRLHGPAVAANHNSQHAIMNRHQKDGWRLEHAHQ